jgi:hypothetical protein
MYPRGRIIQPGGPRVGDPSFKGIRCGDVDWIQLNRCVIPWQAVMKRWNKAFPISTQRAILLQKRRYLLHRKHLITRKVSSSNIPHRKFRSRIIKVSECGLHLFGSEYEPAAWSCEQSWTYRVFLGNDEFLKTKWLSACQVASGPRSWSPSNYVFRHHFVVLFKS